MLSISVTTRAPRPGEEDRVDYRFVSPEEFSRLERDGAFLEAAEVFGEWYGTPRAPVEEALGRGQSVVLEIDVQGAKQVKRTMPRALLIFIEPPSIPELRRRLAARATEDPEAVERRLGAVEREMGEAGAFDARVTNLDLGEAAEEVLRILDAHETPPQGQGARSR